jgi:dTDP-4-dehydrorhamnose 3,5-epimerase
VKIVDTAISEVKIVEPAVFSDDRGFFMETWNARAFAAAGLPMTFVQDNHSRSARGVLRGLHYQVRQPQGKLVRAVRGAIFDVAVDLRRSSPTFKRWVGVELDEVNRRMLWVPPGFAHGFLALQDDSEALYKCTDFHAPEDERSLLWSDPEIGVEWPLPAPPILSGKDAAAPVLAQADTYS